MTLLLAATAAAEASSPPAPAAPLREVAHLQRFLSLAARAHPHEPPIRVLFYGQSIIGQWYAAFRDHLRQRYPDRPWQFENRALDGHLAPYLLQTAEADVYRFQPDLLVFHAYDVAAPWASYAELLRQVRLRTCADILMVGNHLAVGDALDDAVLTNSLPPELWPGTAAADYLYLPAIAAETGACRADLRSPWKSWLRAEGLEPWAVRSDFIHLNATGVAWVVRLLAPYVEPRLFVPPVDPFQSGRVRRVRLDGRSELTFTGNRLLLAAAGGPSRVACRVDGQRMASRLRTGRPCTSTAALRPGRAQSCQHCSR